MTALQSARSAYARPEAPARTSRSIEYDLLARTTQRMSRSWDCRKDDYPALVEALSDNLRLWTTLAVDVAQPENGLPPTLRAQLFYLYQFTTEHTRAILKGSASVVVLVEINTAVMRGLRGDKGTPS